MILKNFLLFFLLIINFNLIYCTINSIIYNKIIDWYENSQNITWTGIYFNEYIDKFSSTKLKNQIISKASNDIKHIFIVLDTDGGNLLSTYQIIDLMDLLRINYDIKIHCVAIKAYSSGFFIYQLCDYRYLIVGISKLMTHEPKLKIEGTFGYVSNYVNTNFVFDYQKYTIIIKRICSKLSINETFYYNKISYGDWIIDSNLDTKNIPYMADFYFIVN